jgi:hypothetical protein
MQIKKGEFEQLVVDQKSNVMRNFEGSVRDIFILRYVLQNLMALFTAVTLSMGSGRTLSATHTI